MARNFTKRLREIDDAGLDVYQYRLLMHIFRVGHCYKSQRKLAEDCKISLGKIGPTLRWLEDNGWLKRKPHKGHMAYVVCSPHEQTQQFKRSPDEQNVHVVNKSVHVVNKSVHDMNAILRVPNEEVPNEEYLIKTNDTDYENQKEWSEIIQLMEFFHLETGCLIPTVPQNYIKDRLEKPFYSEWARPMIEWKNRANGNTEELIKTAIKEYEKDAKYPIASPKTIHNLFMRLVRQQSQPAELIYQPDEDGVY